MRCRYSGSYGGRMRTNGGLYVFPRSYPMATSSMILLTGCDATTLAV